MDERLRIFLWMVSGGGLGAALGSAFGGLTGMLYAHHGGAAGTGLGRRVANSFARAGERELTPIRRAAITGAADGFLFLGLLGIIAGALLGASNRSAGELLLPAAVGSVILTGGAAFFGLLAYGIVRNGVRAVLDIFASGLLGAFLAGSLLGADSCLLGAIPGLVAGLALSLAGGRYAPTFRSPLHPPRKRPR